MLNSAELSMKKVSKFCQYFKIYKQNKFHAQLSWAWEKFYNFGAWICAFCACSKALFCLMQPEWFFFKQMYTHLLPSVWDTVPWHDVFSTPSELLLRNHQTFSHAFLPIKIATKQTILSTVIYRYGPERQKHIAVVNLTLVMLNKLRCHTHF